MTDTMQVQMPNAVALDVETVCGALSLLTSNDVGQQTEGIAALSRLAATAMQAKAMQLHIQQLQEEVHRLTAYSENQERRVRGAANPRAKPLTGRALKAHEKQQQALCDGWKYPEGTAVNVRKDGGEVVSTKTRSMPWMLGGTAVIQVEGISGGYSLERVSPVFP